MEENIKIVMANVLGIDATKITEDASPDTIDEWDSLKHMNLVLALEEEFDVVFSDEQIIDMLNYKLICVVVRECMQ